MANTETQLVWGGFEGFFLVCLGLGFGVGFLFCLFCSVCLGSVFLFWGFLFCWFGLVWFLFLPEANEDSKLKVRN